MKTRLLQVRVITVRGITRVCPREKEVWGEGAKGQTWGEYLLRHGAERNHEGGGGAGRGGMGWLRGPVARLFIHKIPHCS